MEFKQEYLKYEDAYQRRLAKNFDTLDNTVAGLYLSVESWRDEAVERLVAAGGRAVKPLIRVLTGDDGVRRFWGIEHDRNLLQNVNYVVKARSRAEKALGRIGEPALQEVLALLDSKEEKVREAAARILNVIGAPAVDDLLVLLQKENNETRALAASALAGIDDARVVEALHRVLSQEVEEYRKRRKRGRYAWLTLFLAIYPLYIFVLYDWLSKPFRVFPMYFISVGIGMALADEARKVRRNIVSSIKGVRDTRMVSVLAACLFDKDKLVRESAAEALKPLLLQMRASDQTNLTSEDRELLVKALSTKNEELLLALLKAFEQIGDERAVPHVERLTLYGRTEKIRSAAEECLPYLRVKAEEARQAKTLLRPAGISETVASETLLRPAQGVAPIEEAQLLRPS
jgi:HEAT repeat protein